MNQATAFETVRDLVAQITSTPIDPTEIGPSTSLVLDLGLTSLKIVDLTLALEEAFGLDEFPIQEWMDRESAKKEQGFAVQSLVAECDRLSQRS